MAIMLIQISTLAKKVLYLKFRITLVTFPTVHCGLFFMKQDYISSCKRNGICKLVQHMIL